MNHLTPFSVERVACPQCGTPAPQIALLTTYIVYLRCGRCDAGWGCPATNTLVRYGDREPAAVYAETTARDERRH